MVAAVSSIADIPVMVGGGLETPEECAARVDAGASFVVMGTSFEREPHFSILRETAAAVHREESVIA